ncbi:hypothetical protein IKF33_01230 [Candidatus Saccharibacteria bacterium]|nr:hypothetical protein [Candidatus Saccharibacteria bacterium]
MADFSARAKLRAYKRTHKRTRKMESSQKIVLCLMITSSILVIFALIVFAYFYSDTIVKNRLSMLAKVYYEDYYYNNLTNNDTKTNVLESYAENGLPMVRLNQLLSFDNHKYAEFESDFVNSRYTCDLNNTSIKYYPVAPYGPQDYNVKYTYACSHIKN